MQKRKNECKNHLEACQNTPTKDEHEEHKENKEEAEKSA